MSSSYRSNKLGVSHWDPYAGCLELYYCNMVESWFPPFDIVGLVIWPVKIVPEMTYGKTLL